MNCDDKIKKIIENNNIRRKLCEIGICNIAGPTGPQGPEGPTGPSGPTDTYDYFFNKINRNYSSILFFKYK